VGASYSAWDNVASGVPQGSVLAPLLFILYVHDMQAGLNDVELLKFADDTKLYCSVRNNADQAKLQSSLDILDAWCKTWKMPVNVNKCSVVKFGHDNGFVPAYTFNGVALKASLQERDLGVIMSGSLSYKFYIQAIAAKALKIYGWMVRNLVSGDKETILKVYKSLIRPMLEYACAVWSPSRVGLANRLEHVQRKVTKLIVKGPTSYEGRLRVLRLPSLRWRRNYLDLLKVHQILHGDEQVRKRLFTFKSEVSATALRRHRLSLYRQVARSNVYHHHFVNRTIDQWNSLPVQLLRINRFELFKRNLKVYLMSRGDAYK
jgi:hypothetical protein